MMDSVLTYLVSGSARVALAALAGGLAISLARVRPAARYACWRGLLAVCLVVPIVRSAGTTSLASESATTSVFTQLVVSDAGGSLQDQSSSEWLPNLIVGVLIAGIALRLLWIGVGLFRLRRLARVGL